MLKFRSYHSLLSFGKLRDWSFASFSPHALKGQNLRNFSLEPTWKSSFWFFSLQNAIWLSDGYIWRNYQNWLFQVDSIYSPPEKVYFTKTSYWLSTSHKDKKCEFLLFQVDSIYKISYQILFGFTVEYVLIRKSFFMKKVSKYHFFGWT